MGPFRKLLQLGYMARSFLKSEYRMVLSIILPEKDTLKMKL
jgi:hypothetical protein